MYPYKDMYVVVMTVVIESDHEVCMVLCHRQCLLLSLIFFFDQLYHYLNVILHTTFLLQ